MARKMRDIMSPAPVCMAPDESVSGDRESLAGLLAASGQPARLAAALVRVSLSQRAASEVTASVRD